MDIHQSTASNLARGLIERELIAAGREGADRRAVQLRLLPAGARLLRKDARAVLRRAAGRPAPARRGEPASASTPTWRSSSPNSARPTPRRAQAALGALSCPDRAERNRFFSSSSMGCIRGFLAAIVLVAPNRRGGDLVGRRRRRGERDRQ